jgi:hypothetical protein
MAVVGTSVAGFPDLARVVLIVTSTTSIGLIMDGLLLMTWSLFMELKFLIPAVDVGHLMTANLVFQSG